MKQLLITMLTLFCLNSVFAQSHNPGPNSNCKLNKNYRPNIEKIMCPACDNVVKKEKEAKAAEDKRRVDVMVAKAKAEQLAWEKARLEKIRLEQEEAKRIKDKEIADKIASDAMMKKYKEIAEKGQVKSNVKGKVITTDFSLDKIETFSDNKRKIYGFKAEGVEVLTFPFDDFDMYIKRIDGANYFRVDVYSQDPIYKSSSIFKHSYLINYLGEKLEIDGILNFNKCESFENTIYLIKRVGEPEIVNSTKCYYNYSEISIFDSRESAIALLETLIQYGGGLAICYDYKICYANQYKVDLNGKLLEKNSGYQLISY